MNRRLGAIQAAPAVWQWLAVTRQARLLYLFDHAINLVNEYGDVLSVVTPKIGAGPFHVVVNGFVAGDLSPIEGDESPATNIGVQVQPDGMQIGKLWVDVRGAAVWPPRVNWERLRAHTAPTTAGSGQAVWHSHLPHLQRIVQQHRMELGLDTTVWQPPLQTGLDLLLTGIAQGDTVVIQSGTAQLAGLGPGLTPAGDDVLMGVMLGLWATKAEATIRPLAEVMVATAVPRTTTLSAAGLRAAGRGEAGWLWHELSNRLSVTDNRWEETVAQILATGHSSGADALLGFLSVIRGW
ncbi:MAG: DUF2877 domain-containing protein [Ardenticatenaceae bacterium]|nr:DUF2877 domain-containing protein [Ardenticatenaceae bacterium]